MKHREATLRCEHWCASLVSSAVVRQETRQCLSASFEDERAKSNLCTIKNLCLHWGQQHRSRSTLRQSRKEKIPQLQISAGSEGAGRPWWSHHNLWQVIWGKFWIVWATVWGGGGGYSLMYATRSLQMRLCISTFRLFLLVGQPEDLVGCVNEPGKSLWPCCCCCWCCFRNCKLLVLESWFCCDGRCWSSLSSEFCFLVHISTNTTTHCWISYVFVFIALVVRMIDSRLSPGPSHGWCCSTCNCDLSGWQHVVFDSMTTFVLRFLPVMLVRIVDSCVTVASWPCYLQMHGCRALGT